MRTVEAEDPFGSCNTQNARKELNGQTILSLYHDKEIQGRTQHYSEMLTSEVVFCSQIVFSHCSVGEFV